MRWPPAAINIEGYINPIRALDSWINLVLQPVLGNFLVHHAHIPRVTGSEVSATTGKAKASLGRPAVEHRVRSADLATLTERNNIAGFLLGLWRWFSLRCRWLLHRLLLRVLLRDRNRFFLFHRRLRL